MSEARVWKLVDTFLLMSLGNQGYGASEGGVLFRTANFSELCDPTTFEPFSGLVMCSWSRVLCLG